MIRSLIHFCQNEVREREAVTMRGDKKSKKLKMRGDNDNEEGTMREGDLSRGRTFHNSRHEKIQAQMWRDIRWKGCVGGVANMRVVDEQW